MRQIYTLLILFWAIPLVAQESPTPSAAFDVIIKTNGDILYGKVMEVTADVVKYKRTDIPDGPIYHLPRLEVYAISYRNQLKEILNPLDISAPKESPAPQELTPIEEMSVEEPQEFRVMERGNLQRGELWLGLGLIPGYSKIDNRNDYTTKAGFPALVATYMVPYRSQMMVGLQVATGTTRYSRSRYDDYDEVRTETELKENIISISVLGKYQFSDQALRPYVLGGLSFNISGVNAESRLNFVDDDREIFVKSGVRNTGLSILARVGLAYELNNQIGFYGDIGSGITLLQFGATYQLNR
jgi:hypothetical protein